MNGWKKSIVLTIVFATMILCFWNEQPEAGGACLFLLVCLWTTKGALKEINFKECTISFYNIKEAELFKKSKDWKRYGLNIRCIKQSQVDTYKNLKLQRSLELTSPFNYYRKKKVDTLNEYRKYIDNGYYPATTLEILEASHYNILILLLDLFKNAKEIKESNKTLKYIVPKLPASEVQFLAPMDEIENHRDENIEQFFKNDKISVQTKAKEYNIVVKQGDTEEFITFTELLRADFHNKGYEEILVVKYFHSAGTFQICEPLILRNVEETYFVVPIEYKQTLRSKLINFIRKSKFMRPLCKLIRFFVKDNIPADEFSKFYPPSWDNLSQK